MDKTKQKRGRPSRRVRMWSRIAIIVLAVVLLVIGVVLVFRYSTYKRLKILKSYESEGVGDGNYIPFSDMVLEYGRDGISLLNRKGEEKWNQPCQIANPIVDICGGSAVVGDRGGTSMYVVKESGVKGEIQTTRPIERITVSAQGIVGAVLQDEESPIITCYDSKGNILIEQKTSIKKTGYPIDMALSESGEVLLVSYLYANGGTVSTKVCFYHFGEAGKDKEDFIVAQKEYEDVIAPTVCFLNGSKSMVVTDSSLILYKGTKSPKEVKEIHFDSEIQSVASNGNYVAVVLEQPEGKRYQLRLYETDGKLKMSVEFGEKYAHMQVVGKQVVLYEENRCRIYNNAGICKFHGTFEKDILNVYPIKGLNKYMLISANAFHEVRLAR